MSDDKFELELLKPQIESGTPLRISYNFTKASAIFSLFFALAFAAFMAWILPSAPFPVFNRIMVGIIALGILMLVSYQFIYASYAELTGKRLFLKRIMGKTYDIDVQQVQKISSFSLRNTRYTTVKFTDNNGKLHKALILNSNSLIMGKDIPAGDIIKLAQSL